MVQNRNLTSRQQEAFDFIRSYLNEFGAPPTLREMGKHLGIGSPNGVKSMLDAMVRKGYLEIRPGVSRGITIPDEHQEDAPDNLVHVPLVGRVAAGSPILAEENREGYLHVDTALVGNEDTFALTVQGDSMEGAGILDGDTVIARLQPTARSGDMIVAIVDEEATVKFYFPEKDQIRLQPANPRYDPIMVDPARSGFRIAGKIVALIRKF